MEQHSKVDEGWAPLCALDTVLQRGNNPPRGRGLLEVPWSPGRGVALRAPRARAAPQAPRSASSLLPQKGKMSFLEEKRRPELLVRAALGAAQGSALRGAGVFPSAAAGPGQRCR